MSAMQRRGFLKALGGALALGGATGARAGHRGTEVALGADMPFSAQALTERARNMATRKYRPRPEVPAAWQELSYELYKSIWFKSDAALWHGSGRPLNVDFFHPGLYFSRPVSVFAVERGTARQVRFELSLFAQTDKVPALPVDETLGFSGFRLRAEREAAGIFEEFLVFQGASYFRAIGRDNTYGLSARGLAIDTAEPGGEEFPDFTEFYLEAPEPGSRVWRLYALLDGPSATGVYRFDISTGAQTVIDVSARVFARRALTHLGIAPLTSMFLFDETNRNRFDDFRPAVHDSEGLSVLNGAGEMLWRPLANPKALQVSSFVDTAPKGFGLMQRSRRFSDFADLEALYHKRPSLWIEPGEDWGRGAVTLVEIPADREIYDNIVAYWRPRDEIAVGQEKSFSYRMIWGAQAAGQKPVAQVVNTRIGKRFAGGYIVAVDFAPHPALGGDLDALTIHLSSNQGQVSSGILQRNPDTGGPRLTFSFDPGSAAAIELRAQLRRADGASTPTVTEVWLYRWTA